MSYGRTPTKTVFGIWVCKVKEKKTQIRGTCLLSLPKKMFAIIFVLKVFIFVISRSLSFQRK